MSIKLFNCRYFDKIQPLCNLGYVFRQDLSNFSKFEFMFEYKDGIEEDLENLIKGDTEIWERLNVIKNGSKKKNQDLDFL